MKKLTQPFLIAWNDEAVQPTGTAYEFESGENVRTVVARHPKYGTWYAYELLSGCCISNPGAKTRHEAVANFRESLKRVRRSVPTLDLAELVATRKQLNTPF